MRRPGKNGVGFAARAFFVSPLLFLAAQSAPDMTPKSSVAERGRTPRLATRTPKVHARDFFARTGIFDAPASSAKPLRIWEKSSPAKKTASGVTVDGNGNVRALVKANGANPAASSVVERYAY